MPFGKLIKAIRESAVLVRLTFDLGAITFGYGTGPYIGETINFIKQLISILDILSENLTARSMARHSENAHAAVLKKASRLQLIYLNF